MIIGAGGGIGQAFVELLMAQDKCARVTALTRQPDSIALSGPKLHCGVLDISDEASIEAAALSLKEMTNTPEHKPAVLINCTGILHDKETGLQPERSHRHLSGDTMMQVFAVNTFGPALLVKYFLPLMPRDRRSIFASLSARVGSISDNRIGGWYAYRASKAAHNMMLKTASLEAAMRYKELVVAGLHPGTVDTGLSAPFQGNVTSDKLFTPKQSAGYLLEVLDGLTPAQSGRVFAWDGQEVPA